MFNKILIANRGEIAVRIIRTAHRLGIHVVMVYSAMDRDSLAVELADSAYELSGTSVSETYLDIAQIMAIAKKSGAQAIHPGYGFLSERADFAQACEDANVIFIGPPSAAISLMGEKDAAKKEAQRLNVPIIPGYHGDDQSLKAFQKACDSIGYPVLLKAVSGGGGKGMRIVRDNSELQSAVEGAKREALASFGDDRLLLERYLMHPRHIEAQILMDQHGHGVHLYERDCSIQRRHQKIIEEAPAEGLDDALREKLGEAALTLARAIAYCGVGTVEFLVDPQHEFYFMEMNTRLQVEHPVTEAITGLDLVEWQLRVASGEALAFTQSDIMLNGHAIEVRIYAEDPAKQFLPATGNIEQLRWPSDARIDHALKIGSAITPFYDPLLAKLIVWGSDRAKALTQLRAALLGTELLGLKNNIDYLSAIANSADFSAGHLHTNIIPEQHEELLLACQPHRLSLRALAVAALVHDHYQQAEYLAKNSADSNSPWHIPNGFRLNVPSHQQWFLFNQSDEWIVKVQLYSFNHIDWFDADVKKEMRIEAHADHHYSIWMDDFYIKGRAMVRDHQVQVWDDQGHRIFERRLAQDVHYSEDEQHSLRAPMHGKIIRLLANKNERVERGTPLVIVEAMKMEHTVLAPSDGMVIDYYYGVGDMVAEGAQVVHFEKEAN